LGQTLPPVFNSSSTCFQSVSTSSQNILIPSFDCALFLENIRRMMAALLSRNDGFSPFNVHPYQPTRCNEQGGNGKLCHVTSKPPAKAFLRSSPEANLEQRCSKIKSSSSYGSQRKAGRDAGHRAWPDYQMMLAILALRAVSTPHPTSSFQLSSSAYSPPPPIPPLSLADELITSARNRSPTMATPARTRRNTPPSVDGCPAKKDGRLLPLLVGLDSRARQPQAHLRMHGLQRCPLRQ
jgi:hypothetical protein